MSRKKLRRVTLVLVGVLLPVGTFGFGYFLKQESIDNKVAQTLTVDGDIGGEVVNKITNIDNIVPGDTINKNINILPNATTPSLLRVKIEPNWYEGDEKSKFSANNVELIYTDKVKTDISEEGDKDYWYKSGEYLYYMDSVTTKDEAIELVKGVKFNGGSNDTDSNQYQGKNLKIKVTMDMIQGKYAPYKTRWNVDSKSELYSKLKSLCLNADDKIE